MFNIRFPMNAYLLRLVQYRQYSSGFTNEVYQELLKHVTNQDKIKTENFRQILPYLKSKDSKSCIYKPADKPASFYNDFQNTNSTTGNVSNKKTKKGGAPEISILTNIFDTLPEIKNTEPQSRNISTELVDKTSNSVEFPSLLYTGVAEECPPQGLPTNLVPITGRRAPVYLADLSNAGLPLPIHHTDDSMFITTSYVQQLLEMVEKWLLQTNKQGKHLCKAVKELNNHSGLLHELLRQQVTALVLCREKTALWLYEKKEEAEVNKEEKKVESTSSLSSESVVDKIKKVVERILVTLKNKLEEQKNKEKEEKK